MFQKVILQLQPMISDRKKPPAATAAVQTTLVLQYWSAQPKQHTFHQGTLTRKFNGFQKISNFKLRRFSLRERPADAYHVSQIVLCGMWQGSQKGRVWTPGVIASSLLDRCRPGGQFCRNRGRGRREIHLRRVCTSGCVWSLKAYNSWVVFHIWANSVGSGCEWYI